MPMAALLLCARMGVARALVDNLLELRSWTDAERLIAPLHASASLLPHPPDEMIQALGSASDANTSHAGGRKTVKYMLALTRLQPSSKVLEMGCGYGRNARWLSGFLQPEQGGSYSGFDVSVPAIEWSSKAFAGNPHVSMKVAEAHNEFYHDHVWQRKQHKHVKEASSYVFPYEQASFDVVTSPGLFPHLKRADMENYVKEAYRTLKPGGTALFWYYLMDASGQEALASAMRPQLITFAHPETKVVPLDDRRTTYGVPEQPEGVALFNATYVYALLKNVGFAHVSTHRGSWRESGQPTDPEERKEMGLFDTASFSVADLVHAVRALEPHLHRTTQIKIPRARHACCSRHAQPSPLAARARCLPADGRWPVRCVRGTRTRQVLYTGQDKAAAPPAFQDIVRAIKL